MGIIIDIIRMFLWGLAYAIFIIGDAIYSVTMKVGKLDIGQLGLVWEWWTVLSLLIAGIAMIRILMIGIRYFFDEELQEKLNVIKLFGRVMMVGLAIALTPMGVKYITSAGAAFTENIFLVTGNQSEMVPSTLIISSVIGDAFQVDDGKGGYEIPKNYKLSDIEINHKASGSNEYTYFKEMGDIFVLIVMGGLAVVGLVLVGIEMAERYFKLGIKILISPLPISALANPEDESFNKWCRLVIADVVVNCAQLLSLIFVLATASSNAIRSQGVWVTLIVFIGGTFAVLKGVPEIAPLIGGDTSTQGALQQIASLRQATSGLGRGAANVVGGAMTMVGEGAKTAGATATYFGGRALGGKSIADISSEQNAHGSSRMNSNSNNENDFKSGGQQTRNQDRDDIRTSSSSTMDNAYHDGSDNSFDSYMNMEGPNADIQGTTQAYNSQDNSFSGASEAKRYDTGGEDVRTFGNSNVQDSFYDRDDTYGGGGSNSSFQSFQEAGTKQRDFDKSESFSQSQQSGKSKLNQDFQKENIGSLARSGSFASNFVEKAYSKKGGRFAKVASTAGHHVYQSSMNRVSKSMPMRASVMYRQAMEGTSRKTGGDE